MLARVTDTSIESDVEALAEATLERFGGVHLVCNNAGVGSRGLKVADLPRRDFEWVIGVNLWGVIHGIRAFLPHLIAQDEGHIVNTASVSGLYHHAADGAVQRLQGGRGGAQRDDQVRARRRRLERRHFGAVPELGAHEHLDRRAQPSRTVALRADA